jgi:hypothetical protein
MGRRRRQENTSYQRTDNSIEDSVENEGNEHPVAVPNRMRISMFNELSESHKEML